jgi:hypothetical protein
VPRVLLTLEVEVEQVGSLHRSRLSSLLLSRMGPVHLTLYWPLYFSRCCWAHTLSSCLSPEDTPT